MEKSQQGYRLFLIIIIIILYYNYYSEAILNTCNSVMLPNVPVGKLRNNTSFSICNNFYTLKGKLKSGRN